MARDVGVWNIGSKLLTCLAEDDTESNSSFPASFMSF